ncbi:hypothetical protein BL175_00019605 [Klebsiella pneumoniae]|nr:hypothetical protein BL175_00019605 [Klebsiella pneumoniae]RNQ47347.1 hypothetical protein BL176_00007430 [Klebsiella pneumoniae]
MKDREAVCEKVRAVGLIYQQSVEGDSRTLKIKNPLKAGISGCGNVGIMAEGTLAGFGTK